MPTLAGAATLHMTSVCSTAAAICPHGQVAQPDRVPCRPMALILSVAPVSAVDSGLHARQRQMLAVKHNPHQNLTFMCGLPRLPVLNPDRGWLLRASAAR